MNSTALCTKAFDLQKVTLHFRAKMAFDVFRDFLHQAKIYFLDFAAIQTKKMVVVSSLEAAADVIPQLPIRIRDRQKNSATRKTLQYPVYGGKPHARELLLQFRLHFERLENGRALQEKSDHRPNFWRAAMAVLL